MSFEERVKGEKASIGYSVSGHGLDGLKPFVDRRIIGKEHVVEFLKRQEEREVVVDDMGDGEVPVVEAPKAQAAQSDSSTPEDTNDTPKKKEREKMIRVRFV
ncbi:MAG: hypothetical protein ACOYN2_02635 [Patescibacteria group bacterium]